MMVGMGLERLKSDLQEAGFLLGVNRGQWRLLRCEWPYVFFEVCAIDKCWYCLRLELSNYPQDAPWGCLCDMTTGETLSVQKRPKSRDSNNLGIVSAVFQSRHSEIYAPCDRHALVRHDHWPQKYPHKIWSPDKTVTFYLEQIHDALNSPDYQAADNTTA